MIRFTQYPFALLLLVSTSLQLPRIIPKEDLVDWNPQHKLTWNDYKAKPDPYSDAAASTTTIIGVEYKINSNSFTYNLNCQFSRDRSWGLHKTEYILKHEQGHFDIAEIFARKLNMELGAYQFNPRTYEQDLNKIYDRVMREKENMQNLYDKETNHSINREIQQVWLEKIRNTLEDSGEYAAY